MDPLLSDLVDDLQPSRLPQVLTPATGPVRVSGVDAGIVHTWFRIDDDAGAMAGVAMVWKPAIGMSELATAAAFVDPGLLQRMHLVLRPDRPPAAILLADLEASSPLSRRMSAAQYFALGRRLIQAADGCVVEEGGIVGRHAGGILRAKTVVRVNRWRCAVVVRHDKENLNG